MELPNTQRKKKILIVEDQFIEAYDLQLILEKAGYIVTGIAHSVKQGLEKIEADKPDLVCLDIFLKGTETGIDLAKKLRDNNIGFIYISANSGIDILNEAKKTQPYGFIVKPFREQDVLTTLEIACYRHKHSKESLLQQIAILQKNIDAITYSSIKWETAFLQLGLMLQPYIPFDYMVAGYNDFQGNTYEMYGLLRKNFNECRLISPQQFAEISGNTITELASLHTASESYEKPAIYENQSFIKACHQSAIKRLIAESFGIRSFIALPLVIDDKLFNFFFYSRQPDGYNEEQLIVLNGLENILSKFIRSMQVLHEKNSHEPAAYIALAPQITGNAFEGMVGNSKQMISVYNYIRKVAPSDTSVLILGESGTGKEKVAQSIHKLSPRKDNPFIVINCGAIPDNLAESILFGHEKGAFTGATERQLGKFELADGGTIFLDEIGEMPIDLQVKLLRVLQENEIERIGGRSPIKINARIIAATNKDLEHEVAAGRFRIDLYYRLHVFPITLPSLRERCDDIPALVSYFIESYGNKMGRKKLMLSNTVLDQIMGYQWPGNIRQLEHAIQRCILLTEGNIIKEIQLPRSETVAKATEEEFSVANIKTIQEMEREYINFILTKCKGKVYGMGGAAELLDIPPSTLNSKIKKLGIKIRAFT